MHHIQKKILHKLYTNQAGSFTQLKPETLENNVFDYHLKQLQTQGLVAKNQEGLYELSEKGLNFVDRLSGEYDKERIQAKIITIIILTTKSGKELLYKRKHQPYLESVGFLSGKTHFGESAQDAANRELSEKAGLSANLAHRADVYVSIYKDEKLLTQVLGHVFGAEIDSEIAIIANHPKGESFWGKLDGQTQIMPGTEELKKLLNKNKQFFFGEIKTKL